MSKSKKVSTPGWFAVERCALREALMLLRIVAPQRSTLPVLSHVLLKTTADTLVLTATDLSTTLTLSVPAQVETPDTALALPARTFGDWVNTQPLKDMLTATQTAETATATLQVGRATARIKGIAAEEFPAQPPERQPKDAPTGITLMLDAVTFAQSIRRVAFAAASGKEGRVVLEGVFARIANDELTLVAADGFQLAVERLPLDHQGDLGHADSRPTAQGIVPANALELVAKLLAADESAPFALTLSETHVQFRVGDHAVDAALIEGKYPDFERIVPAERATQATFDPAQVAAALKATAPFSTNGVELTFAPDGLTVAGAEAQTGDLTAEVPLISTCGLTAPVRTRVHGAFLRQVCAVIAGAEELVVELDATPPSDPHHPTPMVLRLPSVPTWKYVVMPLAG